MSSSRQSKINALLELPLGSLYDLMIEKQHKSRRGGYWLMSHDQIGQALSLFYWNGNTPANAFDVYLFGKPVIERASDEPVRFVGSCSFCGWPAIWIMVCVNIAMAHYQDIRNEQTTVQNRFNQATNRSFLWRNRR